MGKKRQPIYKVVAADERSPRDGKFIEAIGLYNPITDPATIDIKEERALYWLGVGAQPTTTVKGLLWNLNLTGNPSCYRFHKRQEHHRLPHRHPVSHHCR